MDLTTRLAASLTHKLRTLRGTQESFTVDLGDVGERCRLVAVGEQRLLQLLERRVDLVQGLLVLGELAHELKDHGHVSDDSGADAGGGGRHGVNLRTCSS